MRELVQRSLSEHLVRTEALRVIDFYEASGIFDYINAVRQYVLTHVQLVGEYQELLIAPWRMIAEIKTSGKTCGDCDDVAMITATLLAAIGLRTRFKAIFRCEAGWYQHVFTEFSEGGLPRWVPCDPTTKQIPIYENGDFITLEI